jgi:DUF971 family protein
MQPGEIQLIGNELAIKWEDGGECYISLEKLRRYCPCADCKGEMDIMGHLHRQPGRELSAASFELKRLVRVGGYAIQPVWGDGHATGLYSFDYLRRIGAEN